MTIAHIPDIIDYGLGAPVSTSGGACTLPETLLTSGVYQDNSGQYCSIYPLGYPTVWPEQHHYRHYPWSPFPTTTMEVHTHVTAPAAEKPHEVVQRALKEIAQATRALRDSAQAMGVPVDAGVLEEAIARQLHEALAR